jgi:hypothetical protein
VRWATAEITDPLFSLPRLRGRVGEGEQLAQRKPAPSRRALLVDLPRKRERCKQLLPSVMA